MKRGSLRLIIGNMFANKTGTLIHEVETMRTFGRKKVLVFKPVIDTRSGTGKIKNFHGKTLDAIELHTRRPLRAISLIRREEKALGSSFDVIAFDEVQFFGTRSGIYLLVNELLRRGYDVIAAGLRLDFKGEPFGATLALVGLCDSTQQITLLSSFCARCGSPAHLPQRLIDGKPAPYRSAQVQVGGRESYEARCYACHELPHRPLV